ncbi:MAG: hypothetical protein KDI07_09945 [Anaerolineae bacterium]|nr:hypothetical protein [Anaerolineae bacterium]MCB9132927.1 hypothetical protein [Anaerolineales bacterium]MCB0232950.1 hypothetical protein [Anaerolineae bacterium]MCB0243253.1 hypothetical protein [Anaerolineae bacterium]MCB0248891.1 hypothetical protein [Anaerolineae bacterium]
MNFRTEDRDQLLSAYLDGQTSPREQARVAALLEDDPVARSDLQTLTYTRQLLAETPRVPVPRAFTLNESMVGVRRPERAGWLAWLQPAHLRLATAMMAILLVVLVAGDFGTRWQASGHTSASALVAPAGGLALDQGDPTGITAAKTATTESGIASPATFLGLPQTTLLALEVGLAILVLLLLAAGWRMTRA